jgi:predicted CopG family antitoxin
MITDEVYGRLAMIKGERSFSELLSEILSEVKKERNIRLMKFFGILSDKEADEMKKNVAEFRKNFKVRPL